MEPALPWAYLPVSQLMSKDHADNEEAFAGDRRRMVDRQLRGRGIDDSRVLDAMARVPRHLFVPPQLVWEAYADQPLPIGEGQTISQPFIVALMTQALRLPAKAEVLEIGTGSGYQTAVLAELAEMVLTIERSSSLSARAKETIGKLGYNNIEFVVGDGTIGLPESAPFDRIIATGSLPRIPSALCDQLRDGGTCVMPIGDRTMQELVQITREGKGLKQKDLGGCCFVPLIGKDGWKR